MVQYYRSYYIAGWSSNANNFTAGGRCTRYPLKHQQTLSNKAKRRNTVLTCPRSVLVQQALGRRGTKSYLNLWLTWGHLFVCDNLGLFCTLTEPIVSPTRKSATIYSLFTTNLTQRPNVICLVYFQ